MGTGQSKEDEKKEGAENEIDKHNKIPAMSAKEQLAKLLPPKPREKTREELLRQFRDPTPEQKAEMMAKKWGMATADEKKKRKKPPVVRIPLGLGLYRSVPFTPELAIGDLVWHKLVYDAEIAGISEYRLRQLFHKYCKPTDDSYGTILITRLLNEMETKWRHVVNISLKRKCGGFDRIKFEDYVSVALDFSRRDLFGLVRAILDLMRTDREVTDALDLQMLYHQLHDRWPQRKMLKEMIARLHDRKEPHTWDALVHLMMRYPVFAVPFLQTQESLERRFFGLPHWQQYHRRAGHELYPAPFSIETAETMTARVVMLETISTEAIPFLFGTNKTRRMGARVDHSWVFDMKDQTIYTEAQNPGDIPSTRTDTTNVFATQPTAGLAVTVEGAVTTGDAPSHEHNGAMVPYGGGGGGGGQDGEGQIAGGSSMFLDAIGSAVQQEVSVMPSTLHGQEVSHASPPPSRGQLGPHRNVKFAEDVVPAGSNNNNNEAALVVYNSENARVDWQERRASLSIVSIFQQPIRDHSTLAIHRPPVQYGVGSAKMAELRAAALKYAGKPRSEVLEMERQRDSRFPGQEPHIRKLNIVRPPPKVGEFLEKYPRGPNNSSCNLTSMQIARAIMMHAHKEGGMKYGVVVAPCLLCGRQITPLACVFRRRRTVNERPGTNTTYTSRPNTSGMPPPGSPMRGGGGKFNTAPGTPMTYHSYGPNGGGGFDPSRPQSQQNSQAIVPFTVARLPRDSLMAKQHEAAMKAQTQLKSVVAEVNNFVDSSRGPMGGFHSHVVSNPGAYREPNGPIGDAGGRTYESDPRAYYANGATGPDAQGAIIRRTPERDPSLGAVHQRAMADPSLDPNFRPHYNAVNGTPSRPDLFSSGASVGESSTANASVTTYGMGFPAGFGWQTNGVGGPTLIGDGASDAASLNAGEVGPAGVQGNSENRGASGGSAYPKAEEFGPGYHAAFYGLPGKELSKEFQPGPNRTGKAAIRKLQEALAMSKSPEANSVNKPLTPASFHSQGMSTATGTYQGTGTGTGATSYDYSQSETEHTASSPRYNDDDSSSAITGRSGGTGTASVSFAGTTAFDSHGASHNRHRSHSHTTGTGDDDSSVASSSRLPAITEDGSTGRESSARSGSPDTERSGSYSGSYNTGATTSTSGYTSRSAATSETGGSSSRYSGTGTESSYGDGSEEEGDDDDEYDSDDSTDQRLRAAAEAAAMAGGGGLPPIDPDDPDRNFKVAERLRAKKKVYGKGAGPTKAKAKGKTLGSQNKGILDAFSGENVQLHNAGVGGVGGLNTAFNQLEKSRIIKLKEKETETRFDEAKKFLAMLPPASLPGQSGIYAPIPTPSNASTALLAWKRSQGPGIVDPNEDEALAEKIMKSRGAYDAAAGDATLNLDGSVNVPAGRKIDIRAAPLRNVAVRFLDGALSPALSGGPMKRPLSPDSLIKSGIRPPSPRDDGSSGTGTASGTASPTRTTGPTGTSYTQTHTTGQTGSSGSGTDATRTGNDSGRSSPSGLRPASPSQVTAMTAVTVPGSPALKATGVVAPGSPRSALKKPSAAVLAPEASDAKEADGADKKSALVIPPRPARIAPAFDEHGNEIPMVYPGVEKAGRGRVRPTLSSRRLLDEGDDGSISPRSASPAGSASPRSLSRRNSPSLMDVNGGRVSPSAATEQILRPVIRTKTGMSLILPEPEVVAPADGQSLENGLPPVAPGPLMQLRSRSRSPNSMAMLTSGVVVTGDSRINTHVNGSRPSSAASAAGTDRMPSKGILRTAADQQRGSRPPSPRLVAIVDEDDASGTGLEGGRRRSARFGTVTEITIEPHSLVGKPGSARMLGEEKEEEEHKQGGSGQESRERTSSSVASESSVPERSSKPPIVATTSVKTTKSGKGFFGSFMRRNSKEKEQDEVDRDASDGKKQDTASSSNVESSEGPSSSVTPASSRPESNGMSLTSPSRPVSTAAGSAALTTATSGVASGSTGPTSIARSESSYHTLDENGAVVAKPVYTYHGRRGKRAQTLLQSTRAIVKEIDGDTAGLDGGSTIHAGIPLKLRLINKSKYVVPRRPAKDALVDLEAKEEELEDAAVKAILNRQRREIAKWDLAHIAAVAAQDLGDDTVKTQIQRMMNGTPVTNGTVTPGALAGAHAPHLMSSGRSHRQGPPGTGYTQTTQMTGLTGSHTGSTYSASQSGDDYNGINAGSSYAYVPDGGHLAVGESLPALPPMTYGSRGVSPEVSPFASRRDSPAGSQIGAAAAAAAASGQGMDFSSAQQRLNHALAGFAASAPRDSARPASTGRSAPSAGLAMDGHNDTAVLMQAIRDGAGSPADLDQAATDQELGLDDQLNEGEEFRNYADEYEEGLRGGEDGKEANRKRNETTPFDLGASPGPLAYSPTTGSPILFGTERDRDTPAPPLAVGPNTYVDPNMPDLPNRMKMLGGPSDNSARPGTANAIAGIGLRDERGGAASPAELREYFVDVGNTAAANGVKGIENRGGSPESLIETPPGSPTALGNANNMLTPPRRSGTGPAVPPLPSLGASGARNTSTAGGVTATSYSHSNSNNNQSDRRFGAESPAGMTELPFIAVPGSRLQTPASGLGRKMTTGATGASNVPPPSAGGVTVVSHASQAGQQQQHQQPYELGNTMASGFGGATMGALRTPGGHDYYQQAGAGVLQQGDLALSLVRSPGAPPTPAGFGANGRQGPGLNISIPGEHSGAVVPYNGQGRAAGPAGPGDTGWQLGSATTFQHFQETEAAWERESQHISREKERLSALAVRTGNKLEDLAVIQGVSLVRRARPPKPRRVKVSNTGFCVECDDYIWHALAHLFGFKFADFILKSAAVQPSGEDEVELQSHAARVAGQGITDVTTIFHKTETYRSLRPTQEQEIRNHVRTYKRADDIWLQLLDDGTGRWFYYNVSSGEASWIAPPHFVQAAEFANAEQNQ